MRHFVLIELLLFVEVFLEEQKNEIKENDLAHGFGDDIEWVKWSEAKEQAKTLKKPIFLLIHKSWCGACQALKSTFRSSTDRDEFVKLSKEFVMVNTEDDEEPNDERYSPDGQYIPRIFFLDVDGTPFENINNKASYPRNSHYFPQLPNLIKAMNKALKAFGSPMKVDESDQTIDDDSTKQQKMKVDEKEDGSTGCPYAAKASVEKKEQEAKEKVKKREQYEERNQSDEVRTDNEETHVRNVSRENNENAKEREKKEEREKDENTKDKNVEDKEKRVEEQKTEL
uniref:Thioredoxin domain-containing protein n=1 Tax=Parascaris univalens TaxID=6257 RepID=A0A915BDL8_PARUN